MSNKIKNPLYERYPNSEILEHRTLDRMFQNFLDFLLDVGRLKLLKRTGWIYSGVNASQTESIAEHSYRTAIIALFLCKALENKQISVDTERALTMALLHDLPEAFTHDIDRRVIQLGGEAMKQGKQNAERMALVKLRQKLGELGNILEIIWANTEAGVSLEARIVQTCDRLETAVQAYEYVLQGYRVTQFTDFWKDIESIKKEIIAELGVVFDQIIEKIKEFY